MSDGASSVRLRVPGASAEIDVVRGGRLVSLRIDGVEILGRADLEEDLPFLDGSFPMAPFAGRIGYGVLLWDGVEHRLPAVGGPHAIHGTVLDRPWTVEPQQGIVDRSGHSVDAPLVGGSGEASPVDARGEPAAVGGTSDLSGASTATAAMHCSLGPLWPWPGRAIQRWTLVDGALMVELAVEAQGQAFPAWLGFHPWFRRSIDRPDGGIAVAQLDVRPELMYRRGADGLPTGELVAPGPHPWDDCVVRLAAPPTITWPGLLRLRIDSDASHWVVYDERPEAICVEPQTGPPDAARLGEAPVVPPYGRVSLSMRLSWHPA